WIGSDDRARLVEWSKRGASFTRIDGEPADLRSAQRLLYGVAAAALLGLPVREAMDRPPATPLPLNARKLLLSLREATFASADALLDGVSTALASPAVYPRASRGAQIAASAALPAAMTLVAVGGVIWAANKFSGPEATQLGSLMTWAGLWVIAIAAAAGTSVIAAFFNAAGAILLGS